MKTQYSRMNVMLSTILVLLILLSTQADSYNILMIPLAGGKSHVFSFVTMTEGLADRGHNVTLFLGDGARLNDAALKNRSEITVVRYRDALDGVPADYDAMFENMTRLLMENQADLFDIVPLLAKHGNDVCTIWTMNNDDILDNMKKEQFDVAVVDGLFFFKCIYLIPHRLQIPWITYTDVVDPLVARVPWLPSFVPVAILPYTETMTFSQRLINSATMFAFSLYFPLGNLDPPAGVIDKYRKYGYFNSLDDLISKSLLWLYTKDSILDYPRPMMTNIIDVGGLTVKRATGELPPEIKKFIYGAKNGIVLMTFGSLVTSYPGVIAEKFLSAFRRLDGYRVIWKMKNTDNVSIPDNVMISQWLPQNEILAHPSTKLFITHSGNNGQLESLVNGVPMIGFPVAGDQSYNSRRLDHKGFGLSMNLYDFTADELLDNIHKILGDKSYKERVMKASEIFRSQAQSPAERAAFWIEHVCRFGGDHLRSAGNDLPLYSYLMLDILAFVLIILHIIIYLLYRLFTFIMNKCRGNARANKTTTKKDD